MIASNSFGRVTSDYFLNRLFGARQIVLPHKNSVLWPGNSRLKGELLVVGHFVIRNVLIS